MGHPTTPTYPRRLHGLVDLLVLEILEAVEQKRERIVDLLDLALGEGCHESLHESDVGLERLALQSGALRRQADQRPAPVLLIGLPTDQSPVLETPEPATRRAGRALPRGHGRYEPRPSLQGAHCQATPPSDSFLGHQSGSTGGWASLRLRPASPQVDLEASGCSTICFEEPRW